MLTFVVCTQSDSEPEAIAGGRGGLQRPTISSQNKNSNGSSSSAAATPASSRHSYNNVKSAAGIINRRRGMSSAYSSGE